jgi:hypothetical protein
VIGGVVYSDVLNVDNFEDPNPAETFFISALNPNPTVISTTGAGILGGRRDTTIEVLGPANPISANGYIGAINGQGVFNLGTGGFGPSTEATLNYNGSGYPVDLTSGGTNTGLRFDFNYLQIGSSPTMDMDILVTSSGGSATFSTSIAANVGAFINYVELASFVPSGGFSFTDVTNIQVRFNHNGSNDVDFEITQITGVRQTDCGYNFGNFPNPSCLSGFVYVDSNRNCNRDPREAAIKDVIIKITGVNDLGQNVCLTTTTDCNGFYKFENLRPGCYTITECQPINFLEGGAQIGSQGGQVLSPNALKVNLGPGVHGTNNNFGERGLTMQYVSKRYFIDPRNPVCLSAVYPACPPSTPSTPNNPPTQTVSTPAPTGKSTTTLTTLSTPQTTNTTTSTPTTQTAPKTSTTTTTTTTTKTTTQSTQTSTTTTTKPAATAAQILAAIKSLLLGRH